MPAGLHLSEPAVLGVLSLVFWSLILIVTVKYVVLILRADNRGEGGVLALGTLASRAVPRTPALCWLIPALTVAGLALFYGDGLITPAISVLSAVEGLKTAAPALEPYVVPIAALVLLGLFLIQSRGTARVGALFGPVMLVWFATLGLLGLAQIVQNPAVLAALDPRYALGLFGHAGWQAFVALGAIVLAVTGAEALYADMGHFGRTPIRLAWFGLVLPGLVLNYFGQGALVLREPAALEHPFYHLVPGWALWPLIGLATCATIIASQAVISGVFSLTRQAIQLGYLPRMTVRHTSATEIGQIYIPRVNWLLMTGVLLLVFGFRSSGNLAAAYGISVTGAMAIDAILAGLVAAWRWGWGAGCGTGLRRLSGDRPRLFRRQRAQDPLRRLVPARGGRRLRLSGGHLAPRPGRAVGQALRPRNPPSRASSTGSTRADPGPRHGGVHDRQPRGRADGAAAQHQAQSGPARAGRADDRAHAGRPLRPGGAADRGRARLAQGSSGSS